MYIFPSARLYAWKASHFTIVSNCPYLLGVERLSLPCYCVFALVVFLALSCQQKLNDSIRLRRPHFVLCQSICSVIFLYQYAEGILVSQKFISCHFPSFLFGEVNLLSTGLCAQVSERGPPFQFFRNFFVIAGRRNKSSL